MDASEQAHDPWAETTSTPPDLPGAPRSEQWVCAAAVVLGLVADLLAFRRPLGIGATVTLLLLIAAIALLHGRHELRLASRSRLLFLGAAALLACFLSLRTSVDLALINLVAIVLALILTSVRVRGRRLRDMRVAELCTATVELTIASAWRACLVAGRQLRPRVERGEGDPAASGLTRFLHEHGRDITVGLLIAIPVLGVFVGLLTASDPGFARLMREIFDVDLSEAVRHSVAVLFGAFLAATALVAALASEPTRRQDEVRGSWAGPAVLWIVLGSSAILFIAFLALQGAYLFGGPEYLDDRSGLSAAEYAVRGFYELLAVSGLVVALLLTLRHGFDHRVGSVRAFRILAPTLAGLSVVLLGSALARLWIYQDRFGLTEQRIYAVAVLVWIAAVLLWLASRIAAARTLQLGVFAGAAALVVVMALNVVNPDGLVASTNLERSGDGRDQTVDTAYLRSLSDDATPAIASRIDRVPPTRRRTLQSEIHSQARRRDGGWRSSNLGHHRAEEALEDLEG